MTQGDTDSPTLEMTILHMEQDVATFPNTPAVRRVATCTAKNSPQNVGSFQMTTVNILE